MDSTSSFRPTRATYLRSARALGALGTLLVFALAALSAIAINDLAHQDVTAGAWLLVGIVAARWALAGALDEWGDATAARLRLQWRGALVQHFALPSREGARARTDLALAIDQASTAPMLERLKVSAGASVLGLLIVLWAGGWLPFAITLALLALAAPLYRRAGQRSEAMAARYQERRALLEARQLEVLQHAPELRGLGAVTYGADEIAAISKSEHSLALRAIRVALESSLVTEFLSGVSVGLVAMVVGFALLEGRLSLARALVAVLVTSELFAQVRRFGVEFHRRDDAQRALATLDTVPPAATPLIDNGLLLVVSGLVTEASATAIDLSVGRGDHVVITGPSGAGKTTLLHTLLGWRPALHGTTLRTNEPIGYVSIESQLLSGSLRDNLTLGAPVPDEVIAQCVKTLGLGGERFGDLDAPLLSEGRGLSSGERVRLILARSLLANSKLLILDDVAGVLDAESRAHVREALAVRPDLAIVEVTVDTPVLDHATHHLQVRA